MKKAVLVIWLMLSVSLVTLQGQGAAPNHPSQADEKNLEINETPTSQKVILIVLTAGGMFFLWLAYRQSKWGRKK